MLSRATIVQALTQLSDELGRRGVIGELNVLGGTAMDPSRILPRSTYLVDEILEELGS